MQKTAFFVFETFKITARAQLCPVSKLSIHTTPVAVRYFTAGLATTTTKPISAPIVVLTGAGGGGCKKKMPPDDDVYTIFQSWDGVCVCVCVSSTRCSWTNNGLMMFDMKTIIP